MITERLKEIEKRYNELSALLASPELLADSRSYRKCAKERAEIEEVVAAWEEVKRVEEALKEATLLMETKDEELRELAREEAEGLKKKKETLERKLNLLLLPRDPNDEKNIMIEIRAGAGGEEAALFAAELFRMYARYAERQGWKAELLSSSPTGLEGFKEVIALIEGKGAYSRFKYESGVHRVQRVPETEAAGRRHTSTVTVAVMPEAEDVEVDIKPDELRVDTFRAGGHGGQNVNKVETAVRITHIPTQTVVSCQDEKSQHKNRQKAMKILLARLLDKKTREQEEKISAQRRTLIGTAERAEKIRTYNFPQNRVTDHRVGLTIYRLTEILDGDLEELVEGLTGHYQTLALKKLAPSPAEEKP
jgi:peptide chain release factor 1